MKFVTKDLPVYDYFPVVDAEQGQRVAGLTDGSFQTSLYDPDGVTSGLSITLSVLPNGLFSVEFTPDAEGTWILNVDHPTYFPYGRSEAYHVLEYLSGAFVFTGSTFYDGVQIVDLVEGARVGGITESDVTISLYGPDGTTSALPVHFQEIPNNIYRAGFKPNEDGRWILNVDSPLYFPFGKSAGYDSGTHIVGGTITYLPGVTVTLPGSAHRLLAVSTRKKRATVSRTTRVSTLIEKRRSAEIDRTARTVAISRSKKTVTISQQTGG